MQGFKLKILLISVLLILGLVLAISIRSRRTYSPEDHLNKYLNLLKREPNNCFYAEQVAASYQQLNKIKMAIEFYKKALSNCPDKALTEFQLGVCHYLIMEREVALKYMDDAINKCEKNGDEKMVKMLQEEKELWLKKWDSVKDLEWNKKKEVGPP